MAGDVMPVTQSVPSEVFGSAPVFPRWVDQVVLGTAAAENYTVPAGGVYGLLTCDAPIYARAGAAASVPVADITDGTGSFLISAGVQLRLEAGVAYSLIRASGAAIVTIGVYKN